MGAWREITVYISAGPEMTLEEVKDLATRQMAEIYGVDPRQCLVYTPLWHGSTDRVSEAQRIEEGYVVVADCY